MSIEIPPGIYPMTPCAPTAGKWYHGYHCPTCEAAVPLMEDLRNDQAGNLANIGWIRYTCPACGKEATHIAKNIEYFQWPAGASTT